MGTDERGGRDRQQRPPLFLEGQEPHDSHEENAASDDPGCPDNRSQGAERPRPAAVQGRQPPGSSPSHESPDGTGYVFTVGRWVRPRLCGRPRELER